MLRLRFAVRAEIRAAGSRPRVGIHDEAGDGHVERRRGNARRRHQRDRRRVLQHELQARWRQRRLEREIGRAGAKDPEQPDDHLDGPVGAQADHPVRPGADRAQAGCQPS